MNTDILEYYKSKMVDFEIECIDFLKKAKAFNDKSNKIEAMINDCRNNDFYGMNKEQLKEVDCIGERIDIIYREIEKLCKY